MANCNVTPERLREVINYDPLTGAFIWAKAVSRKTVPGKQAGNRHPAGYLRIRIDGVMYKAHRLAWLYVHGVWPVNVIDHINGNNSDNRIENLRDATQRQNMENRKGPTKKSTSGHIGVYWHKQNKCWRAQICTGRQIIHLGVFRDKEDAIRCRLEAEKRIFTHSPACEPRYAYHATPSRPGGSASDAQQS